jgi:hypothetical protein
MVQRTSIDISATGFTTVSTTTSLHNTEDSVSSHNGSTTSAIRARRTPSPLSSTVGDGPPRIAAAVEASSSTATGTAVAGGPAIRRVKIVKHADGSMKLCLGKLGEYSDMYTSIGLAAPAAAPPHDLIQPLFLRNVNVATSSAFGSQPLAPPPGAEDENAIGTEEVRDGRELMAPGVRFSVAASDIDDADVDQEVMVWGVLADAHGARRDTTQHIGGWIEKLDKKKLRAVDAERLTINLGNLRRMTGHQTPAGVQAWINVRYNREWWSALIFGAMQECGFQLGMTVSYFKLIPSLGAEVLRKSSRMGAFLGGGVGLSDVGFNIFFGLLHTFYKYGASALAMPEGFNLRGMWEIVLRGAGRKAVVNAGKNIWRATLPQFIKHYERMFLGHTDGLISERTSDIADVEWDGIAGLLQGAFNAVWQHVSGDGISYPARLMLQPPEDFISAVKRSSGGDPALAILPRAPEAPEADEDDGPHLRDVPSWLKNTAPVVIQAIMVWAIVVVHISMLISRNANILSTERAGLDEPEGRIHPNIVSFKTLSSTHQMALMTLVANLLLPAVAIATQRILEGSVSLNPLNIQWGRMFRSLEGPDASSA